MNIDHSPLEIVRGVAPMLGVGAVGVALGMLLIGVQVTVPSCYDVVLSVSSRCQAAQFASKWSTRLLVFGAIGIGVGMAIEAHLDD